jgi:hypothetical protein
VQGFVDPSLANGQTVVSLEQGGVLVKSTVPDITGSFQLTPVAPGAYDLVLTAPAGRPPSSSESSSRTSS